MKFKKNNLYLVLILVVLFGISIGYAAISRVLIITGNSLVKQNTWDIHFENIQVMNRSVEADLPVIDVATKISVNFNVMLNLPGDFYEFTIDVVNDGTIDAMIESFNKTPELSDEQKKYINYVIEYQNGEQITTKQLVEKDSFVRIKVRVEYRKDLLESELPTVVEELNLGFIINYVQSDSNAFLVKNNGVIGANGDINELGTIVTIGTEKFYTIGTEGDNVKLLSMYNLYVGYKCEKLVFSSCIQYGSDATGMQDEKMKGYISDNVNIEGSSPFSKNSQKGENYSDYSGSIVEGYVDNYKGKLEEKFNINVVEARLISKDELSDTETFNCFSNECLAKYPWIYSIQYWTSTPYSDVWIWTINRTGMFGSNVYTHSAFGVRPVIVVSKSYFI